MSSTQDRKAAKELSIKVKAEKVKNTAEVAKIAAQAKADLKAKIEDRILPGIISEINTRLEKALALDGKADDHRLAAALQLAKASEQCKLANIPFEAWAEKNIKGSWENTRKLLYIGRSEDPPKALADLRGKVKVANKKLRAKKKAQETVSTRTRPDSPFAAAEGALEAVEDTARLGLIASAAGKLGMTIVSKTDAQELRARRDAPEAGFAGAQDAFEALGPSDKMSFATWVAEQIGAKLEIPKFGEEDLLEIPEVLKRTVKRK